MADERTAPGSIASGAPGRRLVILLAAISIAGLEIFPACRPAGPEGGTVGPPTGEPTVSITLAWDPPETDADGAPLEDLAGYRLYFGTTSPLVTSRDTFVDVGLATSYTLRDLTPGTYYFATTAVDTSGNESVLSAETSAELDP